MNTKIWLYRFAAAPLFTFALPILAMFNNKIRKGLGMRMKVREFPNFETQPLWIHASSGEFEYAKPVIRELRQRFPQLPIVVTYFSPTFALGVENFPGVDFALPLPLDLPGPCAAFLNKVKPRALLIARTDFWPEMLTQTRERGIPIQVFSYTQREGASRWLTRFRLNLTDQVDCVSANDQKNVQALGVSAKIEILGDTRYDQVRYRLDHPKEIPPALRPTKPCLVAGSTWTQDEDILIPGLRAILTERRMQLILVPHEPDPNHIAGLKSQLEERGLTYALFSEQRQWDDKHVLIVDRVGVLAELYLWADLAFIGGSFKRTVHSVMEALGTGAVTLVGPKHVNNREAMEFKKMKLAEWPALTVVNSEVELDKVVRRYLSNSDTRTLFKTELKQEFNSRLGASRRLVDQFQDI